MPMPALLMRKSKSGRPKSSRSTSATLAAKPAKVSVRLASNGSMAARAPAAVISAAAAAASSSRL